MPVELSCRVSFLSRFCSKSGSCWPNGVLGWDALSVEVVVDTAWDAVSLVVVMGTVLDAVSLVVVMDTVWDVVLSVGVVVDTVWDAVLSVGVVMDTVWDAVLSLGVVMDTVWFVDTIGGEVMAAGGLWLSLVAAVGSVTSPPVVSGRPVATVACVA